MDTFQIHSLKFHGQTEDPTNMFDLIVASNEKFQHTPGCNRKRYHNILTPLTKLTAALKLQFQSYLDSWDFWKVEW